MQTFQGLLRNQTFREAFRDTAVGPAEVGETPEIVEREKESTVRTGE